jgi:hypothetical protein
MTRIESKLWVPASVETVFGFLDEAENHARFIPNMAEFNKTSPGRFGQVGTTIQGVLRFWGQRLEVPYMIIDHADNQRLAMQGSLGPLGFKDGYILSAAGGGTTIQFWLELMLSGLGRVLGPAAGLIGWIHARETLTNLKHQLARLPDPAA